MPNLHKVLAVASSEASREPAFGLITQLRDNGYSVEFCHAGKDEPDASPSKFKIDRTLEKGMGIADYDGVVFFDDGGDARACADVAKRLDKQDKMVAGYGKGCLILSMARLLDDKFVCKGLPEQYYKGSKVKVVNSPSVRCDNVVTSLPGCLDGFVVLLLDVLGGEVKKIVTGERPPLQAGCAMVVSRPSRWAEYWGLAERLAEMGTTLVVADWDDIDAASGVVSRCLLLDPAAGSVKSAGPITPIPMNTWFKQTSIGAEASIVAVAALEAAGCVNVNSSESMRKAANKGLVSEMLAGLCRTASEYDGANADRAACDIMSCGGAKWARSAAKGSGRRAIRVLPRGDEAIATRKARHRLVDRAALASMLRTAFNDGPFLVQEESRPLRLADKNFCLRFVMRKSASGWSPSCEVARSDDGLSCSASHAMRIGFPDEWEDRISAARGLAEAACVVFQASLENPDGLRELGVDVSVGGEPDVVGVTTIPDLVMVDAATGPNPGMVALGLALGAGGEVEEADGRESREGVTGILGDGGESHSLLIERELAHEGVWLQPSGEVVMKTAAGLVKMAPGEAVDMLRKEALVAIQREMTPSMDEADVARAAMVARRARHRMRLLKAVAMVGAGMEKVAYSYDAISSSPYQHLDLPMSERVYKYEEEREYFEAKDEFIRKQPRYNPEYNKDRQTDSIGFYYVWDEPRRRPEEWYRSMNGEGVYPTRKMKP